MIEPRKIILSPFLTEKSTSAREARNIYSFKVAPEADKRQIKDAVEALFRVEVVDVRTMTYLGKMRRMGRFTGRKPLWKKAVVQLKAGANIPIFEGL